MTVDQSAAVQYWCCSQKASLFFFVFSVKRLESSHAARHIQVLLESKLESAVCQSGQLWHRLPQLTSCHARIFLICLFRAANTSSVIFLDLPEPFFWRRCPCPERPSKRPMVDGGLVTAQPFSNIFCGPACFFVGRNRNLVFNQNMFGSFSLCVSSHLAKTSLQGFVIEVRRCQWWLD